MQYFNYHIPYHPYSRVPEDIRYLPVANFEVGKAAKQGDLINLYGKDITGNISRIGTCVVRSPLTTYNKLSASEKKYCTETNCWLLPVKIIKARGFGMNVRLIQAAGLFYAEDIPFKPHQIVQTLDIDYHLKENFYEQFWYIWKFCFDKDVRFQYQQLVIHLYRDQMMNEYRTYKRFMYKKELRCEKCGMTLNQKTLGTRHFFELHDTETDIMRPFRKLDKNKFIVVCPSCHALLHNATIPEDVTANEKWSVGFSEFYGYGMWTKYLTKDFNETYKDLQAKQKKPFDTYTFYPNHLPHRRSVEDIYALYKHPTDVCIPLDSTNNLFKVYDSTGKREFTIINRFLQKIFKQKIYQIQVCKDKFVIIQFQDYETFIYSTDCKTILWDNDPDVNKLRCDDEGRLYYAKPKAGTENNIDPFCNNYREGCVSLDKEVIIPFEYKSLAIFDSFGLAWAKKGSKWGCIDIHNNTIIPFEYSSCYQGFENTNYKNFAIVTRGTLKAGDTFLYINRQNEVLGTFIDNKIWEKGFHRYEYNGLFGLAKQFGKIFTEAKYKSITLLTDGSAEVVNINGDKEIIKYEYCRA